MQVKKDLHDTLMENMSVALIGGGISYILLTPYRYISSY